MTLYQLQLAVAFFSIFYISVNCPRKVCKAPQRNELFLQRDHTYSSQWIIWLTASLLKSKRSSIFSPRSRLPTPTPHPTRLHRQFAIWWHMGDTRLRHVEMRWVMPVSVQTQTPPDSESEKTHPTLQRGVGHGRDPPSPALRAQLAIPCVDTPLQIKLDSGQRRWYVYDSKPLSRVNFALGQGLCILQITSKIFLAPFPKFRTTTTQLFGNDWHHHIREPWSLRRPVQTESVPRGCSPYRKTMYIERTAGERLTQSSWLRHASIRTLPRNRKWHLWSTLEFIRSWGKQGVGIQRVRNSSYALRINTRRVLYNVVPRENAARCPSKYVKGRSHVQDSCHEREGGREGERESDRDPRKLWKV